MQHMTLEMLYEKLEQLLEEQNKLMEMMREAAKQGLFSKNKD